MSGRFGRTHIAEVATANLFNFGGGDLDEAYQSLSENGIVLPTWNMKLLRKNFKAESNNEDEID
jgi:hypothetical protein